MLWEAVRCLLCSAAAIGFSRQQPCHAGCWELGCRGPGCWAPLKGFASWFHGPGSSSDSVKLTNKLALVQSIVALGTSRCCSGISASLCGCPSLPVALRPGRGWRGCTAVPVWVAGTRSCSLGWDVMSLHPQPCPGSGRAGRAPRYPWPPCLCK